MVLKNIFTERLSVQQGDSHKFTWQNWSWSEIASYSRKSSEGFSQCVPWQCWKADHTLIWILFVRGSPQLLERRVSIISAICLNFMVIRETFKTMENEMPFFGVLSISCISLKENVFVLIWAVLFRGNALVDLKDTSWRMLAPRLEFLHTFWISYSRE